MRTVKCVFMGERRVYGIGAVDLAVVGGSDDEESRRPKGCEVRRTFMSLAAIMAAKRRL